MKILVLYYQRFQKKLRKTFEEHLHAFDLDPANKVFYVNTAFGLPKYLKKIQFDLVVVHSLLIAHYRWRNIPSEKTCLIRKEVKDFSGIKIALPQDEFFNTVLIEDLFLKMEIDHVFSVASPSEWPKIYPRLIKKGVPFSQLLTGYLSESTIAQIKAKGEKGRRRYDVSYRAWSGAPWAGRHAMKKGEVGIRFREEARKRDCTANISVDDDDLLLGGSWYDFLLDSRFVLGVEGGSSLLDPKGEIKKKVEKYKQQHPQASFDEVEKACFPGRDGSLNLMALSPRHLEACMTKTAQILMEGEYNGILKPGVHYASLKSDYSNIGDIFEAMQDEEARKRMVEQTYRDVVESGLYTYRSMVEKIFEACGLRHGSALSAQEASLFKRNQRRNRWVEKILKTEAAVFLTGKALSKRCLPDGIFENLKTLRNQLSKG